MSTTIIDVARKAGVSKSTVSRVLTGGPVSPETKARVLEAMRALNYQPNVTARGLVGKGSRLIGVLVSDVTDPYYSELMRGMEDAALRRQYDLLIYSTRWEPERELACLRRLASRRVDGVIMVGGRRIDDPGYVATCRQLVGANRPLLLIDRGLRGASVPVIEVDNVGGARRATEHLIALGHRRIAHIAGPGDMAAAGDRIEGYRSALAAAGIPTDPELIQPGDFRKQGGYAATVRLLQLKERPTAIFAANDLMALGAWKALMDHGLAVPRDVALVGFDDIELLEQAEVPLTTVRQPRYAMGRRAVEELIGLLENAPPKQLAIMLPVELIVRRSCGMHAAADGGGLSSFRPA